MAGSAQAGSPILFWDGTNTTANGVVDGGAGSWNNTSKNWTLSDGSVNSSWNSATATFSGPSGGKVKLTDNVSAAGLSFLTDGYLLNSPGAFTLTLTGTGNIHTAAGVTATINTAIGGTVGLTKDGTGTLDLQHANTYTGGTTLNAGTLLAGDDNAFGGAAGGTLTINGGTLGSSGNSVSLANAVTVNADFNVAPKAAGQLRLKLSGDVDLGGAVRTITNLVDQTELTLTGAISDGGVTFLAAAGNNMNIVRYTGTAVNTYAGLTTVGANVGLVLDRTVNNSAIPGDLQIDPGGTVVVLRNEEISDTSTVTVNSIGNLNFIGSSGLDLVYSHERIGTLLGNGSIGLGAGTLEVDGGTFDGTLQDGSYATGGVLFKRSGDILTLTGANTYTGGTIINQGRLLANNPTGSATGSGTVVIQAGGRLGGNGTVSGDVFLLSGGRITPGAAPGVSTATLHIGSLTWDGGGQLNLQLGATSDQLAIAGAFDKGAPGTYNVRITDAGGLFDQTHYVLATFDSTTFAATDFSLASNSYAGLTGSFSLIPGPGGELDFDITGVTTSGPIIQNSAPVGTPTVADFIVNGPVTTGGATENNLIHTLTFTPGSSLLIHNTLTVTQGPVTLVGGSSITLDGSLVTNELLLFFGSLLNGSGSIIGNLVNGGVVRPGHSPGQIHLSGNFAQGPAGLLQIQIGGRDLSQHDLLSVGGTANLDGALQIVQLNHFKLKRNKPVTFLTADGGITGRFSMVQDDFTSDTILQPTVVYHSNSIALEAVQGSFAKFADGAGLTPNQKSVARALDSLPITRRTNPLLDYLDYRKLNELPRDFDKIAPEELTSMFTIGVSLANVQSGNIQRRTDDIRSGSAGFNAAGLSINGAGPSYSGSFFNNGVAGPSGDDGKESKEVQQVMPADNRWGTFLSGTGEWISVGNTDNARGYTMDSGGFTLGLDYKVTPNLAIGVAAGYTGTTADLTEGGRVYVNGGKIGLYATYYEYQQVKAAPTMSKDSSKEGPAQPSYAEARGLYADVAVFGGYNSYHTHRAALQDDATGDTDGGELNVLFGTGYDFKKGNFTFGPTASFNYTYLGTSAFTEHGSLAPLNIHGGKGESLRSAFGLKASYDWKVGGVLIKPEIRAAWQHEYGDAAYSLDSSFANGAGDSFRVSGPQLGRDSALLGAGFAIQLSERCSTYFYYDGELGRRNYQSTSVTGGFRLSF